MAVEPQQAGVGEGWPSEGPQEPPRAEPSIPWYHKAGALIYVFFCFELGVFLLLFPWLELWPKNFFSDFGPVWREIWNSPYLRGAVSGVGVIDIGISFAELFRLRRFSRG